MVRDYTNATKKRLLKQIQEIENEKWCGVTDFIGDVVTKVGKWTGLVSVKDDMSNIKSYHKKVLDSYNTTKGELNRIFKEVYEVDDDYKPKFEALTTRQSTYNNKIQILANMLQPNFSIPSATNIKSQLADINKELKAADKKINKTYKSELDFAAKETAKNSAWGFFKGIVNVGVDIIAMPLTMAKNIFTGNWVGIVADVWRLIGDTLSVAGNLSGTFSIATLFFGSSYNKEHWLEDTEGYAGASNMTDLLKADGAPDWLLKFSGGLDTAADLVNIVSDIKNFFKKPSSAIFDYKFGFTSYKTVKKADMTKKYANEYRKWQKLYRDLYNYYDISLVKNVKTIFNYLVPFIENAGNGGAAIYDATLKKIIENSKIVKDAEKIPKIIEYFRGLFGI